MPSLFGAPHAGGDEGGVAGPDAKSKDTNCRTCTDFKSWARVQRGALEVKREVNVPEGVRQVDESQTKIKFLNYIEMLLYVVGINTG